MARIEAAGRVAERGVKPRDVFLSRLCRCLRVDVLAEWRRRLAAVIPDPARRLLQERDADLDGIAQAQDPGRIRERLGDDVAEKRVPAGQLEDVGLARVARKGGAERTQRRNQLGRGHLCGGSRISLTGSGSA